MLTDVGFIRVGEQFPPESELSRLASTRSDRLLYDGEHTDVFDDAFERIKRQNLFENVEYITILNWCEKVPLVFADLLVGEPGAVHVTSGDDDDQRKVEAAVRSLGLWPTIHEGTVEMGAVGDFVFKVDDGEVYPIPAEFWYPIVAEDDIRRILAHVIAWHWNAGTDDEDDWRGRAEIHENGTVTPLTFSLSKRGAEFITTDPDVTSTPDTFDITEVVYGDVYRGPRIFHVPNPKRSLRQLHGTSDIASMQSIVSELEVRFAGVSKVLDKHTDPTAYGPEAAQNENDAGARYYQPGNYIALPDKETPIPGYATWDGQLEANRWFIEKLIEQLYVDTETCPALFGRIESGQGVTESASALKRLLIRPLAKVNRLRMAWAKVIPALIEYVTGVDAALIRIDWRDGIPDDPMETAQTEQTLRTAGVRSVEESVRAVTGYTGAELTAEVERINAENATTVPVPEVVMPETV